MRAERAQALAELLREMREQDNGFFPDAAWLEIHRNFVLPYVEVVLTRPSASGGPSVFGLPTIRTGPASRGTSPAGCGECRAPWKKPVTTWRHVRPESGSCRAEN